MLLRVSILPPQPSCARLAANQERRTESAFLLHPHAAPTRLSRKRRADRESAQRPGRSYSKTTGTPQRLQKSPVARFIRQTARNESRVDAGGHSATKEYRHGSICNRSLHIKLKNRLGCIPSTGASIAANALPNEIDICAVCRWKSSRKDDQSKGKECCSKYCSGNENPWSIPTRVGGPRRALQLATPQRHGESNICAGSAVV
jgi:hypothetical protein